MFTTNIMRILNAEVNGERKIRVEYNPDQNYVLIDTLSAFLNYKNGLKMQGYNTNQDLEWYIVDCNSKPYLVAVGYFDYLEMSTSKGSKKQRRLIKRYNRGLYNCRELHAKGEAMTVRSYLQMPDWWKKEIGDCHIASEGKCEQIFCIRNGAINRVSENTAKLKVPIFVRLPKNISVTIDKNSSGEIIRILKRPKHKWKIFKRKPKL